MSNSIYNEILLEHANHPSHRGEIPGASFMNTSTNASCGDEITIYLKLKNNQVVDASWTGSGCAIAKASADILCCTILGENDDNLIFDEIAERLPGRIKCISTALDTIRTAPPEVLSEIINKL